jgi:hypothetical protein
LVTCPSRTLTTIAAMNTAAYTSSGLFCQSLISSSTLSVILEIGFLLTDAP